MDPTMTRGELALARRVVGLGADRRARRNRLRDLAARERGTMASLELKGHVALGRDGWWRATGAGVRQLRAQLGDFATTRSLRDLELDRPPRPKKPITIRIGKGVMSKDGRRPWAAGTIHATSVHGFMSPYVFSHETVARLLADDGIVEIQVIDENNVQSTISKNWIALRPAPRIEIDLPA